MEFFRQLIEGIATAWGKLNVSARVNIGLAAAVVVVVIVLLVTWGGRPEYVVLWDNLAGEDVDAIVSELRDRGVSYQVTDAGKAVRVPASSVYELRSELGAEGLPRIGGVGFEIFDRPGLGVTDFQLKVNYERALNTELARTISAFDDVRSARVRVTRPEERVYTEDRKEPTASVLLALTRPGALSTSTVNAILHIVATAVVGLKKSNIAVADTQGTVWARPTDEDDSIGVLTSKQEGVKQWEKYLEGKARDKLQSLIGTRRCAVAVSATLNFDEVKIESIEHQEGVVRSEQTSQETITTRQPLPKGPPGVYEGVPGPGTPTPSTSREKESEEATVEYEVPETYRTITKPPGTITKLMVAAVIEGKYQTTEETGERTYVPLDSEEIGKLSDLIAGAVGLDEERGDVLTVTDMPFEEAVRELELPGAPWYSGLPLGQIILGVAALVAFVVLRSVLSKMPAGPRAAAPPVVRPEEYEVPEGVQVQERVKEQIARLSREQPDVVASVLKTWLAEE